MDAQLLGQIIGSVIAPQISEAIANSLSGIKQDLSGTAQSITVKEGKENRISLIGLNVPANSTDMLVNLSGIGRIAGGNIIVESTSQPMNQLEFEVIVDGKVNTKQTIYDMNRFKLNNADLNPIYVIEYHEDATSFGSWLTSSQGDFRYTVGVADTYFERFYQLKVINPYSVDLSFNAFIRYYLWGG